MKDPFGLEQAMNLVWRNLEGADSSELKTALRQILEITQDRAAANAKGDKVELDEAELQEFGVAFTKHITDAYSNCLIYGTLHTRSKAIMAFDPDTGRELKSLCRSIAAEITRSLKQSHACLLAASSLKLSKKEKADIAYLYKSGACFERGETSDSPAGKKKEYSAGSITILLLALCTVLTPKRK